MLKDMKGQRFGRLMVQAIAGKSRRGEVVWECLCDCGTSHRIVGVHLRRGLSRSCGCLRRETSALQARRNNEERANA